MNQPPAVKSAIRLLWNLFFLGIGQLIFSEIFRQILEVSQESREFRDFFKITVNPFDSSQSYLDSLFFILDLSMIYLLSIGSKTCRSCFVAFFVVSLIFFYFFDFEYSIKEMRIVDWLYYPVNAVVIYRLYRPESNEFFNQ